MEYSVKISVLQAYLSKGHPISLFKICKSLYYPDVNMHMHTCMHTCISYCCFPRIFALHTREYENIFYYNFSVILQQVLQKVFAAPWRMMQQKHMDVLLIFVHHMWETFTRTSLGLPFSETLNPFVITIHLSLFIGGVQPQPQLFICYLFFKTSRNIPKERVLCEPGCFEW